MKTHVIGNAALFRKLVDRGGIVVESGRVVAFCVKMFDSNGTGTHLLDDDERSSLSFDLARFSKLTGLRKVRLARNSTYDSSVVERVMVLRFGWAGLLTYAAISNCFSMFVLSLSRMDAGSLGAFHFLLN